MNRQYHTREKKKKSIGDSSSLHRGYCSPPPQEFTETIQTPQQKAT